MTSSIGSDNDTQRARPDPLALGLDPRALAPCHGPGAARGLPARLDRGRATERPAARHGPRDIESWKGEVHDIGEVMMQTSACGLGTAAPLVTKSLLRYFPEQVERGLET